MKRFQKTRVLFVILSLGFVSFFYAQDATLIQAKNDAIGDNLNLEAVASIFGDAKDLEGFEYELNNPDNRISNLDLNADNEVDYLRVVELVEKDTHVIAIQAVIGKDQYQDVATIEVEKDAKGVTSIQVVGDVAMYGPHYIIEPVYVRSPIFFTFFWRPFYHPYHSVYYWGYYPHHFHYWHPVPVNVYRTNIHIHVNRHYRYRKTTVRRSHIAVNLHRTHRRNDYNRRVSRITTTRQAQHRTSARLPQHRAATTGIQNSFIRRPSVSGSKKSVQKRHVNSRNKPVHKSKAFKTKRSSSRGRSVAHKPRNQRKRH